MPSPIDLPRHSVWRYRAAGRGEIRNSKSETGQRATAILRNHTNGKIWIMPRPLPSAFAVMSLLAMGVLALGSVAEFGPGYFHSDVAGPKPHVFQLDLELQRGGVAMYWLVWHSPYPTAPSHIIWKQLQFSGPDLRRSFWEFDAHSLNTNRGFWVFLLAFPIWCVAIPLLIAPLAWLRKRRTPQPSAFPVVMPDGHAA
jgi:hypothetical protein